MTGRDNRRRRQKARRKMESYILRKALAVAFQRSSHKLWVSFWSHQSASLANMASQLERAATSAKAAALRAKSDQATD